MKRISRKLNNKGMTFVEILIAVTILSIVSIVFLRCISQSALYNMTAREKQSALNLAQSLMEGFKAYDLDTIDKQYTTGSNGDFKLYPLDTAATRSRNASGQYSLGNVVINGVSFDSTVEVTPYTAAGSSVVTEAGLVEQDVPNKYCDAIYCGQEISEEQEEVFNAIAADLRSNLGADIVSASDWSAISAGGVGINNSRLQFMSDTVRTTTVDISSNKVDVTIQYDFSFTYEYETTGGVTLLYASPALSVSKGTVTCFDNSTTGIALNNVYLYLYPAYDSRQGSQVECSQDIVQINNNSGGENSIYLVKQKNSALSSGELTICECNYRMKVQQAGSAIKLYHNLTQSLSGHGATGWSSSGSITDVGGLLDNAEANKAARTKETLLYKVKIDVYKSGGASPVYELTGTVNAR